MAVDLSNIMLNIGRASKFQTQRYTIIDYIESAWGLGRTLFPVQKAILKAFYGLPLEKVQKNIQIRTWRGEVIRNVTEVDYFKMLYDERRCNIEHFEEGKERNRLILSIGRRSGKSTMASCIMSYSVDYLLGLENPQKYYGLTDSNVIKVTAVATDKDQAAILFKEASAHFESCQSFRPFIANATQSFVNFQSPEDIRKYGSYQENGVGKSTIEITFKSAVAKGLRGSGNFVVVLDEIAHFSDNSGTASGQAVYEAVSFSQAAFTPKVGIEATGEPEYKMVMISSPLGRTGFFFEQFTSGFSDEFKNDTLCIQAPTWEVNPSVPTTFLVQKYKEDPVVFMTECGAIFTDKTRGFISDDKDLHLCIDAALRPTFMGNARRTYFCGIDLALQKDPSAICIGHLEDDLIVVDLVESIKAGEGEYVDLDRLEVDIVADWVKGILKKFRLKKGVFDSHMGPPFEKALHDRGLRDLECKHSTQAWNSEVYKTFKQMLLARKIKFYNYPLNGPQEFCDYLTEIKELQETRVSENVIKVRAPEMRGKHDDRADAVARMVWVASEFYKDGNFTSGLTSGNDARVDRGLANYRRGVTGFGSSPLRQIKKPPRG